METTMKAKILTGKKQFRAMLDESKNFIIIEATERPEKGTTQMVFAGRRKS